jgi:hypothetical protein
MTVIMIRLDDGHYQRSGYLGHLYYPFYQPTVPDDGVAPLLGTVYAAAITC